jgi:TetR/AcrR family transcriptional repressor of mexJK operon
MTVQATSGAPRRSRGRPSIEGVAEIDGEILHVALEQFIAHGYGVSMSQIVKAAGISKNTMYSRFSSKEDLFRALIQRQISRVAETLPFGSPEAYYDLERGLRNYANRTLEVSLERDFVEVNRLIYSEARRFPELGAAAAERNAVGVAQLSDFIRARADKDQIPCRDPRTVAEVLILTMRGWYLNAMLLETKPSTNVRKQWIARAIGVILSSRQDW